MSNSTLFLICPQCGDSFKPVNSTHTYCTKNCKKNSHRQRQKLGLTTPPITGSFNKDCPTCLTPFTAKYLYQIYCKRSCKLVATHARSRGQTTMEYRFTPSPIYVKTCDGCQQLYTARVEHQKFCSQFCKKQFNDSIVRQRRQKLNETARGFKAKLFFRDEGLCGICKHPVDISLKYPDQMSLSIDHIIPLAKGGAHAMYNLQIAHWICNIQKSDN